MRNIGKTELQVGQWVKFSVRESDLSEASSQTKAIYQENRFFLVISREDEMFDSCRCYLVDISGEKFDYCPRMHSINSIDRIWADNVMVIPKEDVVRAYGEKQTSILYTKAMEHLATMKEYFDKYPAQLLGQTGSRQTHAAEVAKLNAVLTEKADSAKDISLLLQVSTMFGAQQPAKKESGSVEQSVQQQAAHSTNAM